MRILYITYDDLSRNFAWKTHIQAIVVELAKKGHQILVLAPETEKELDVKMQVTIFKMGKSRFFRLFNYLVGSLPFFIKVVRRFNPDIIYIRGVHLTLIPLIICLLFLKPLLIEINGLVEFEIKNRALQMLIKLVQGLYLRFARAIITVSKTFKRGLNRLYHISSQKIFVIENGADLRTFTPGFNHKIKEELGLRKDSIIALFMGSFYKHHCLELLVYTVLNLKEMVPDLRFLMIGEGNQRAHIETLVNNLGLSDIFIFKGEIPHKEIPRHLMGADICLLLLKKMYKFYGPSTIKLYEYMASGKPIAVITDIGDLFEFVNQNRIGLAEFMGKDLSTNARKFSSLIIRLINDKKLSQDLSKNARLLCETKYNWSRAADELESVLKECI